MDAQAVHCVLCAMLTAVNLDGSEQSPELLYSRRVLRCCRNSVGEARA
jgi:hypothetical protein